MKKSILTAVIALAFNATVSFAQTGNTMVGGNTMYPAKNIIENALNSEDHTTLVAAVKAAGLVETLQGKGPFTVLAPTNDAFENLPQGTVETLLQPENKSKLSGVLTYHVLSGKFDFNTVSKAIKDGKGAVTMKTVSGRSLKFMMNGNHNITVTDENGGVANISTYDVYQSNGVIHVLDKVLLPKM
ncbi:MAG: fasciclin domain-containing protein [Bacteroidota bacterium]